MSLSGLALGFVKGWSLTLAMLGFTPFFAISLHCLLKALQRRARVSMTAYSQSGGLAF